MRIFAPLSSDPEPGLQEVEVASFFQIPAFQIIGLPSPEVAEARERVRSAMDAHGFRFPKRKVIVNLSPASVRKRGTGLDLAVALAIWLHSNSQTKNAQGVAAWGELSLDGRVKSVGQVIRTVFCAWKGRLDLLLFCQSDLTLGQRALEWIRQSGEFSHSPPQIVGVENLSQAVEALDIPSRFFPSKKRDDQNSPAIDASSLDRPHRHRAELLPLSETLERMLGVAVGGHHHLLLVGPKGAGKSHALEWMSALLPDMDPQVRLKNLLLKELSSRSFDLGELSDSPVRRVSPHVRVSALVGQASSQGIRPGEFSLAHGGLLIADEFPEWHRDSLESLREPLERSCVTLTRVHGSVQLDAQFLFAGTGNLCPCGGLSEAFGPPEGAETCRCSTLAQQNYSKRISGPILDRMDIVALILPSKPSLGARRGPVSPVALKERVTRTRRRLVEKWGKLPGLMNGAELENVLKNNPGLGEILDSQRAVSLRSRHKILRLALTLAMWDELPVPDESSFLEAVQYRAERIFS